MKLFLILAFPVLAFADDINVKVKGMVCGFCSQGIEKKLKNEPGVTAVDINLENKNVRVKMKDGKDVSNDRLKELLKDAGFNIEDSHIERVPAEKGS